jgi:hypothetical protein
VEGAEEVRPSAPSVGPSVGPSVTPVLPKGETNLNLNVNFNRKRPQRLKVDPEYYDDKSFKYAIKKHVEENRDLYFVKLVAGGLGKKFLEIIEVIDDTEHGTATQKFIKSTYKYSDALLTAWAKAMEMVKTMIDPWANRWASSEDLHRDLIKDDTFVVALADYVAHKMLTRSRGAIIRGRTRYELTRDSAQEDALLVALMRPLHYKFGILERELAQEYFGGVQS